MKILKFIFIIAFTFMLGEYNSSYAQNVLAGSNNNKSPSVTKTTNSRFVNYKSTSNQEYITNSILTAFNESSEGESATISATDLALACAGTGCTINPMGKPETQCLASGSSADAVDSIKESFEDNMNNFKETITDLIGESTDQPDLSTDCKTSNIKTVIRAIDCQRARIDVSFKELIDKEAAFLNKQKNILSDMDLDDLKTEITLQMGTDLMNTGCQAVAARKSAAEVVETSKENYSKIGNLVTNRNVLSPEALEETSALTGQEYDKTAHPALYERTDASLAFLPVTLEEGENSGVTFDDEGYIIGKDLSALGAEMPASYKFDQIFPDADKNYSSMVLDRDVIKDNKHLFVAFNGGVNLINPMPDRQTDLTRLNSMENGSATLTKEKAKLARYSLAGDIINFSESFRSVPLENEDSDNSESSGAKYIKEQLVSLGSGESEYKTIGNNISEYQFLDALANKIPNAPGFYAVTQQDDPIYIDKAIVRGLATTLAVKWKQYQVLEKILAVKSANLAIDNE